MKNENEETPVVNREETELAKENLEQVSGGEKKPSNESDGLRPFPWIHYNG